jgi:hypothetical protein
MKKSALSVITLYKNPRTYLLLSIFVVFIILYFGGYTYQRDSIGYNNMHPIRSMGYPSIMLLFKLLFVNHYLNYLFIFQGLLGILSIFIVTKAIIKQFELDYWAGYIIAFALIIPYIIKIKIGSHIYSEAFTYPLFLFFIISIMRYYYTGSQRKLIVAILLLTLLTTIRTQFIFVFPVIFTLLVIQLIRIKTTFKKVFLFSLLLILSYGLLNLIDCSYHFIVHKKFARTPFTGIQLLTEIMYVSEKGDTILFDNLLQKEAYKAIISEIELKDLNKQSFIQHSDYISKDNINDHYRNTYNLICWGTIVPFFSNTLILNDKNMEDWIELNKITVSMSRTLLKKHFLDYLYNQFIDIYFYGFFPHFGFIFSLLFILILVININNHRISGFLLFLFLLDLSNIILCSFVEPLLIRYLFYTKIVLFVFLAAYLIANLRMKSIEFHKGFQ